MRARRLLCILAVLAAAAMALPGCGKKKPGAKELITQAAESLSEASSMRFSVELDAAMEISQSGASMELTLGAQLDGETVRRPAAIHVKGTVSTSLMDLSVDMEQYTVEEDGRLASYVNDGGQWTRTESDAGQTDQMESIAGLIDPSVSYRLSKDTRKLEGGEAYVLTGEISGDMLEEFLEELPQSEELPGMENGWDGFRAGVEVLLYKDTGLPAEVAIDFADGLSAMLENSAEESGGLAVTVERFTLKVAYKSFDDVGTVAVPDEVKAAAETEPAETEPAETEPAETEPAETGAPANPDGTYTLKSAAGEGSVDIAVPEGYEISSYSEGSYLSFTDTFGLDFDEVYISYMLDEYSTGEDLAAYYLDDIAYYQENEDYTQVEASEPCTVSAAGRQVSYIRVSYTFDGAGHYIEYYAWTELENGLLLDCNVEEYAYEQEPALLRDDMEVLETVFGAVV